jgi:hypothetical protein
MPEVKCSTLGCIHPATAVPVNLDVAPARLLEIPLCQFCHELVAEGLAELEFWSIVGRESAAEEEEPADLAEVAG